MNTFKTIRIKNATFSRHCFYIDTNMYLHDGIFNELNNKVQHFQGFGQSKLLYWFISLKFSEKKKLSSTNILLTKSGQQAKKPKNLTCKYLIFFTLSMFRVSKADISRMAAISCHGELFLILDVAEVLDSLLVISFNRHNKMACNISSFCLTRLKNHLRSNFQI